MQYLYFKPRVSGSKYKSSGLTYLVLLRSAKCQNGMKRDKKRRSTRGIRALRHREWQGDFLHLKKHWVALGAQDRDVGWYVEVAAAIHGDRRD